MNITNTIHTSILAEPYDPAIREGNTFEEMAWVKIVVTE